MKHNRILLVDDEPTLRHMVADALAQHGFQTEAASCCVHALTLQQSNHFDGAILDIMLPDGDGFSLFEQLRQVQPDLPVLFLSARDEDASRLRGLGLGADDYITKPFLMEELMLRLKAVLRRIYGQEEQTATVLNGAVIDWSNAVITRDSTTEHLTAKEFALLKKLWDNRDRIVTTDALCASLWDGELIGYENTLMVHIRRLRKKLEADSSHPVCLLTVRGLGYRLVTKGFTQ